MSIATISRNSPATATATAGCSASCDQRLGATHEHLDQHHRLTLANQGAPNVLQAGFPRGV